MSGLTVAIVGCGLIGAKRADALTAQDRLLGCHDVNERAMAALAQRFSCESCASVGQLLDQVVSREA